MIYLQLNQSQKKNDDYLMTRFYFIFYLKY